MPFTIPNIGRTLQQSDSRLRMPPHRWRAAQAMESDATEGVLPALGTARWAGSYPGPAGLPGHFARRTQTMSPHLPCRCDVMDQELIRIGRVLPFFPPAELSGLAAFLEERLASRLARPPRMRESRRGKRLRTRLPIPGGASGPPCAPGDPQPSTTARRHKNA